VKLISANREKEYLARVGEVLKEKRDVEGEFESKYITA
jgi:hypothetical protein